MINNDRIVPITAIDLISMYGSILRVALYVTGDINSAPAAIEATTANGIFEITESNKAFLMNEPMKSCDIAADVVGTQVFFVPAYDYSGFTSNGAVVTTQGDEVTADGRTLYVALIGDGAVTITKVGF